MLPDRSTVYTGTKASYVALSAVTILALALLCSVWTTDVSGSIALLGLFAVYMASQELLVLFMVFLPASILVDLMRGFGGPTGTNGRGWLIFLQLLELVAKVAGGGFAFSLWRSVCSADYAAPSSYAAPNSYAASGSYTASGSVPASRTAAYQQVLDPFAGTPAYNPPTSQTPQSMQTRQPQPPSLTQEQQQMPQQPMTGAQPPVLAAPHHDLV